MASPSHDWLSRIAAPDNLQAAWRRVQARNKGPGLDGITIDAFQRLGMTHLKHIRHQLLTETYAPSPYTRVLLRKPDGRQRHLHIATVADRIVLQAILNVVGAPMEQVFLPCSYGFRPRRSAHQAIAAIQSGLRDGRYWIVEADLQRCFDSLHWGVLREALAEVVPDARVVRLIERMMRIHQLADGRVVRRRRGVPQGACLAPLLANLYLTAFDRFLLGGGEQLVRYGDDFVTLHATQTAAVQACDDMRGYLYRHLRLRLHPDKTGIRDVRREAITFLNFHIRAASTQPTPAAIERFKTQLRDQLKRTGSGDRAATIDALNAAIRGWGEYFKIGDVAPLYTQLDAWIATHTERALGTSNGTATLTALLQRYRRRTTPPSPSPITQRNRP